jgi:hypothetical protein
MLRNEIALLYSMFPIGMTVKTPIAERTLTSLIFVNLSAAWTLDHESVRGFYHQK